MAKHLLYVFAVATGCADKPATFLAGASTDDTAAGATAKPDRSCGEAWTTDDSGVATQPSDCQFWSPRSASTMDWYAAASAEDAQAGNCGSDCPPAGASYCDSLDQLGNSAWRLPSKTELMNASKTHPDIADVGGRLWSRDTAPSPTSNAWTVDLDRAGAAMHLDKSDDGMWVRCISTD